MFGNNPIFTLGIAFAFFVVAAGLFLAAVYLFRLTGEEKSLGQSDDPLEQIVEWLIANEIDHREYQIEFFDEYQNRIQEIEVVINDVGDDLDFVMNFSMAGELLHYGIVDNTEDNIAHN